MEDDAANLNRVCICIISFLASHATDPHGYFDLKMNREVEEADSIDRLIELARDLLAWVEALGLSPAQMARLDKMLSAEGLPSFSVIRSADDIEIARTLAGPR